MLKERGISEEWVRHTLDSPEREEIGIDKNIHYFKSVPEHEGRILHVIVNPNFVPQKVVTTFFDRRVRSKK
jgi:hypothetical protein